MKNYDQIQWWASSPYTKINLGLIEIDARVLVGFFPTALHISQETIYFGILIFCSFAYFDYLGYSTPVAIKRFRRICAGSWRTVNRNKQRRRRFLNG